MSGRRRRSEPSWDDREENRPLEKIHSPGRPKKWPKSEAHYDMTHGKFSRSPSWDTLQGNRNGPGNDIRRDRSRMYSQHSTFDGWEKQYSTHPSDDNYDMPYRSRDKDVGGNVQMSRDRERSKSPNVSRGRSRDGLSRSIRESSRGRRHDTNASYPYMRNDSKDFASQGGGNNTTESWSRGTDYKDGSRHNDYPHRNAYNNHRNTRIACKFFAAGNCSRDNCKFSHDVPEAAGGYEDSRNFGNKNRKWCNDQQPHYDLNAKSNLGEMEKKRSWISSSWDDVKSDVFDKASRHGHTSDHDNNSTWDPMDDKKKSLDGHASRDASSFHDVGKSRPDINNKKSSWNGPTSWDGVSGSGGDMKSGGFDDASRHGHTSDHINVNNTTWDPVVDKKKLLDGHASWDASSFHKVGKSHPDINIKKSSWNGPTSWDGVSGSGGDGKSSCIDDAPRHGHISNPININNTTRDLVDDEKTLLDRHASQNASSFHDVEKSHTNMDNKKSSWNGPTSWGGVSGSGDDVKSNGFEESSRHGSDHINTNNTTWDVMDDKKKLSDRHVSQDALSFHDVGKAHPNKKSSWNGPTSWDGISGTGLSSVSNPYHKYEEPIKESFNDNDAKGRMSARSDSNVDRIRAKKWDGPLWDEPVMVQTNNSQIRNWGGPGNVENVIKDSGLNNTVSEDTNPQILTSVHDMNNQSYSYITGPEPEQNHVALSTSVNVPSTEQVQGTHPHMETQNKESQKLLEPLEVGVPQPQSVNGVNEAMLTSQLAPQANALPADMSHKGLPQLYTDVRLSNAIDYLKSLPVSAFNQDTTQAKEEQNSDPTHGSNKLGNKKDENTKADNSEAGGKVEEGDDEKEKAMRQFKVGLVELVKEILKPKWKEGKMSRDDYKIVVKKVVDKVTSTMQATQIPKTQLKIEQYLTYSKPKITKLVEAYIERLLKA